MTWVVFWRAAAAIGGLLAFGLWAANSTLFLYRHPRAPDVRVIIDRRTGGAVVAAMADPTRTDVGVVKPEPRAAFPYKKYNFGLMDPGASGQHAFVIKNVGSEVLQLQVAGTTCKCTISGVSDNRVEPGKSATMTMEWNTGRYEPKFFQSALVKTNDPLNKSIEFHVEGQVKALLATEQAEVNLPLIQPGARGEGEVLVFTQMWSDFEVVNASSQLPDLKWTVASVSDVSKELSASAAKRIRFSFESPVTYGSFTEKVRFDIRSADDPSALHHQYVTLQGKAMRRMSFYGPSIGDKGAIELGNLTEGKGKRVKVLAKVRDQDPEITSAEVEVFPSFLQARFAPYQGEQRGLYELTIELPDDVPPCQYNSDPVGLLRIETHHPRIGVVELPVTFAVVPRRSP